MPGPFTSAECRGSNKLLADRAGVLWDIQEVVDAYASGLCRTVPRRASRPCRPGSPVEAAVLSGVGFEPSEVDAVALRSGFEAREVLPALALLELKGYVTRNLGGAFVRRAAP